MAASEAEGEAHQNRTDGNLGEQVFAKVRADILSLALVPGQAISERDLQATYGASRTPIRQALLQLSHEGLVVRTDRSYAVAPIDLQQMAEIFEYREVVEDAAIRLACERASAAELDAIRETIDRGLADFTPEVWFEVGYDVHVQLAALSGNRFLRDAVKDVVTRTARARWLVASSPEGREASHREHCDILGLVRAGRADDAAAAIREHGRDVRDQIMEAIGERRRYFGAQGIVVRSA
ncbi:GntR family transcriptional regulator [Inquilinus sp. CAU 1745]|uniref:GntR family transcriptional regulator n=1 Tax=Inquilinus sp. CAU 1745 TaxID=3140369 RepID=UPI00325C0622